MTTADLVNLVVSRLDSMEAAHADFREEVRRDVSEIKSLARATNGRVTALERREIAEKAALDERRRVDEEAQEIRERRAAPLKQIAVGVIGGVMLTLIGAGLNQLGLV